MTDTDTAPQPEIPAGYLRDAKGRLVPTHLVRDHELLEDQTVRGIVGFADALSAQIGRFKGHTFEDVASFLDLLGERYGQRKRGLDGKPPRRFEHCLNGAGCYGDARWFAPRGCRPGATIRAKRPAPATRSPRRSPAEGGWMGRSTHGSWPGATRPLGAQACPGSGHGCAADRRARPAGRRGFLERLCLRVHWSWTG